MGSRRYALAEIAEINSAQYSPKEKWPLIQYLDTGSVTRGHIDALQQLIPGTDKIPGRARRKVKDGSIVYSMVRPNQEHYALLSNPPANMLASTGFAVIDAKTDVVTPEYLYYALIHPDTTTHFQALAEQVVSTYPTLGRDDLARFEIDVPSLEEQRAIAALLTSFDEKVALNQQTNDYLAGLLDLAYQRFFGPGAKRKVTMRALNEVCDTISVKHAFNKDQLIFLNTGDIEKGLFLHSDYSEVAGMPGQAKKSIRRNDILYSEIRPVNRHYAFVNFDADDYVVSTKLMVLRAKGVHPRRVYQFLTLKDTVSQLQLEAESRSGTFPQIRFENLTHFEIPLLSDSEEDEYLRIILPIYDLIDANNQESFALAALRNTLLPKLMSGEIDVSQIELLTPPNNHLSAD